MSAFKSDGHLHGCQSYYFPSVSNNVFHIKNLKNYIENANVLLLFQEIDKLE